MLDHLSDKAALMVLDNCEQVLEAAADFTEQLTRRSPNVIVIATSREPLAIDGEVVWRLEPLPVTEPGKVTGPRDVVGDAALMLFEQRAAMVRPGFRDLRRQRKRRRQDRASVRRNSPGYRTCRRGASRQVASPVCSKACQTGSRCSRTGGGPRLHVTRPCGQPSSGAWTSSDPTSACSSAVWPSLPEPAASTRPEMFVARRP